MALNQMMLNTLTTIAQASAVDGWAYANAKSPPIRALEKDGHLEGNKAQIDPANADRIAYRLTAKGHAEIGTPAGAAPGANTGLTPPPPGMTVTQVSAGVTGASRAGRKVGVPNVTPDIKRPGARMMALPVAADGRTGKGGKGESYPFALLQAPDATGYDYFFVGNKAAIPATETTAEVPGMPNAFKTVKAAVSSANKRYSKKTPVVEFVARAMTVEGVDGAAVFRVK